MKRFILFCVLFFAIKVSYTQESMGIANSNYAPTQSVHLNPSSIVDSKVWLDINLVGMGAYVYNNYFYFPQASAWTRPFPEGLDHYKLGNVYRGDVNVDVWGPGFTLNLGRHAIGLNTAVRSFTDATRIPAPIAKFIFEGLKYAPQHDIEFSDKDFKTTSLTLGEIGLSYAAIISRERKNLFTGGLTVKYLSGINSIALDVESINYNVQNDSNLYLRPINGKYGIAEPGFGAGQGWSVDVGFTFKKMLDDVGSYVPFSSMSDCSVKDYRYKLGISVMDIGNIKFKKNSVYQEYHNTSNAWLGYDTASFTNLGSVDQNLSSNFYGTSPTNIRATSFTTWLPSYASIQFDYNFGNHFFANLTAIQGFRIQAPFGVHRRSTIAITPRYERRRWEISLPVSLHDFRKIQPGVMLRINNLIIGTDNIIPLIIKTNMNAADIYFNLKIPFFKNPKCGGGGKKHKKGKKGKSGKKGHDDTCPAYQ